MRVNASYGEVDTLIDLVFCLDLSEAEEYRDRDTRPPVGRFQARGDVVVRFDRGSENWEVPRGVGTDTGPSGNSADVRK